jgi:MFS family permease
LALLRGELHFSYTLMGVYTAIWSVGTVLTGLAYASVARRVPRPTLVWASAALATSGATLFVTGSNVALTLAGAGVLGLGGTTLLTVIQTVLSDEHGTRRDRALTEANIGAAACAVLAPLTLGALSGGPAGWRSAFALPAVGLAALYERYRRQPLPTGSTHAGTHGRGRLPVAAWLLAGVAAPAWAWSSASSTSVPSSSRPSGCPPPPLSPR